jgi:hypothetical protein
MGQAYFNKLYFYLHYEIPEWMGYVVGDRRSINGFILQIEIPDQIIIE